VRFPREQPNGVALTRMVRMKRPSIKVVFTVAAENVECTDGLGEAVTAPIEKNIGARRRGSQGNLGLRSETPLFRPPELVRSYRPFSRPGRPVALAVL
jgi:hypothetical protein